jgi:hypothetical protein
MASSRAENQSASRDVAEERRAGPFSLRRVAVLILVVTLLGHTVIRCALYGNLDLDEAEQLVLVQTFSAGYSAQPPLYTWLLWPIVQVLGPTVLALAVLKLVLLTTLYILMICLVRRVLPPDTAWLAAMTPLLLPVIGWEAWRMTHTPLLCVLCLATVLTVLRLRECPTWRRYVVLGVCLGLGMLAKYNFALFAGALGLSAILSPGYRSVIVTRQMLVSLMIAALVVAPHGWWAGEHLLDIRAYFQQRTSFAGQEVRVDSLFRGTTAFFLSLGIALAAPAVLAGLSLGRPARRVELSNAQVESYHLVMRFVTLSLVIYLILVVAGNMRTFRGHWFAPVLLILPFVWFSRYSGITWRRQACYLALVAVAGGGMIVARGSAFVYDFEAGRYQSRDYLYATLADEVRGHGQRPGVIVTPDIFSGGYARLYFPETPVYSLCFFTRPGITSWTEGLVIWDATQDHTRVLVERASLKGPSVVPLGSMRQVHTNRRAFATRTSHLAYRWLH